MSTFENAIPTILRNEGGFVNNPKDPGGVTNFGITLKFLKMQPNVGVLVGLYANDEDVDTYDMHDMTVEQAKAIYKLCWWDKGHYGNISDQTVATKVLDYAVNMGQGRAHKLFQTALNNAFGLSLGVDGALGAASFGAANSRTSDEDKQALITAYCDAAWAFYQGLIANDATLQVFEKGWKNRAYAISRVNQIAG